MGKVEINDVCNKVTFSLCIILRIRLKLIHKEWELGDFFVLFAAWAFLEVSDTDSLFLNLSYLHNFWSA